MSTQGRIGIDCRMAGRTGIGRYVRNLVKGIEAGLAFDMEGTDSHQMFLPPPALASAEKAGEAVEDYWQALLRDVPFSRYATDLLAQAATADLRPNLHTGQRRLANQTVRY